MLTNSDIEDLTQFRRALHQYPEISGEEIETARTIAAELKKLSPTRILTNLGGHGVAAVFDSGTPGPTVLFRAELDALPIPEEHDIPWVSKVLGKSHVCGHDGHMTMLLALGRMIARQPVAKGRVVLMFQPAEEDGSGARAAVNDPAYAEIAADFAFAIHVEPGRPFGHVDTAPALINCASKGVAVTLRGKTAHAASPEDGTSPAPALAELIPSLQALGPGGALDDGFRLVTLTHLRMGEPTFGVAPGEAVLYATLRSTRDDALAEIEDALRAEVARAAEAHGLTSEFAESDHFAASINDPEAYAIAAAAMDALGVSHGQKNLPMRASEDFGLFGRDAKAAMLCLGPGEDYAALHNPDYDFPDDLIPIGAGIFERIARDLLGTA